MGIEATEKRAKKVLDRYKKMQNEKLRLEGQKTVLDNKMKQLGFESVEELEKATKALHREIEQNVSDVNEYIDEAEEKLTKYEEHLKGTV